MTVLEALKAVRNDLVKVHVRIEDLTEIGLPVHNAVQNLGAIIDVLETAEAEKAGAEDKQQA